VESYAIIWVLLLMELTGRLVEEEIRPFQEGEVLFISTHFGQRGAFLRCKKCYNKKFMCKYLSFLENDILGD
jgi:hypothetical protein